MGKFLTYSGVLLDYENISEKDINLIDIAHHLTNEPRYGGAFPFDIHYSVAEHCIIMAQYLEDAGAEGEAIRLALMHDASEAYLKDIPSGLKQLLPDYKRIEERLQTIIYQKYEIKASLNDVEWVDWLDKSIMLNETRCLVTHQYHNYKNASNGLQYIYSLGNTVLRDDDFGEYAPGKVPKQVVFERFLEMCDYYAIADDDEEDYYGHR